MACRARGTRRTSACWRIPGAGLVFVEATGVERIGRITHGCTGIYSDTAEDAFRTVIAHCKRIGTAKFGIQLQHAGRKASSALPWQGGVGLKPHEDPWPTIGPSALSPGAAWPAARAMDEGDMNRVRDAFVDAAKRSVRAGFEAIQLHMAHGYLLHAFASPISNKRNDAYGGSLEGRIKFPLEVLRAVRAAVPKDFALGARISAVDWLEGGLTGDESVAWVKAMKAEGLDFVDVSSGGPTGTCAEPADTNIETLASINLTTGARTVIGAFQFGVDMLDIAVPTVRGRLIAIDSSRALADIDPRTGAKTALPTANAAASTTAGLAYDEATGRVFLSSTGNDSLFTLDIATAAVTLIGSYGNAAPRHARARWDSGTHTLFGISAHDGGLYTINPSTGLASLIGLTGLVGTSTFINLVYDSRRDVLHATSSLTDSFCTHQPRHRRGHAHRFPRRVRQPRPLAYDADNDLVYLLDNTSDAPTPSTAPPAPPPSSALNGAGNFIGLAYVTPVTPAAENCCRGTTCQTRSPPEPAPAPSRAATPRSSPACTGNTFAGCCFGDYDHNGTKDITDIFTFLNAWFGASTYADISANARARPTSPTSSPS